MFNMENVSNTVKVSLSSSGISLVVSLLFTVLSGKLYESTGLYVWFMVFSIIFGVVAVIALIAGITCYLNDE